MCGSLTTTKCIREILGKARARARPIYEAISYDDWKSELHDQLERSGFERIVQAVSRDLVKNAPPRALALASLALEKKFMELENSQSCVFCIWKYLDGYFSKVLLTYY